MKNDQKRHDMTWKADMSHKIVKGAKMKTIFARVTASIMSLMLTSLMAFSLPAHASDIDIYQAAKAGSVTLMFTLDNSGSMGLPFMEQYYSSSAATACNLPSGTSYTHLTDTSTNGTPTYTRDYCQTVASTATVYMYKKQTTAASVTVTNWYSCGASGSTLTTACTSATTAPSASTLAPYTATYQASSGYTYYSKVTGGKTYYYYRSKDTTSTVNTDAYYSCGASGSTLQSDCTTAVATTPTTSGYSTTGTNPVYYYNTSNTYANNYDRISNLKDGMFSLLNGNTTTSPVITKLSDDKVIGLSYFSYNGDGKTGSIVVPARRLDAIVSGSGSTAVTQRQTLMNVVANFVAQNGTPTANAYSDAGAYLMGTTTASTITGNRDYYIVSGSKYYQCNSWSGLGCTGYGSSTSTKPSGYSQQACNSSGSYGSYNCLVASVTLTGSDVPSNTYSGFANSSSDSKSGSNYLQPTSISSQIGNAASQTCSGQGIYVLTDGAANGSSTSIASSLMATSLSGSSFDTSCGNSLLNGGTASAAWSCIGNYSQSLLGGTTNPTGLKIKTAVVGFGAEFASIPSFNSTFTQAQNIANITSTSVDQDHQNVAEWGVYGGGGWYSASSPQDVVNSVNNFINSLNTTIPAVTTGSATVPIDALNTQSLQPFAYFPQFQPTPDKNYQLWTGNVKKYNVAGGVLTDSASNPVVDSSGNLISGTVDLWANTSTTALKTIGGAVSELPLLTTVSPIASQRTLLSNRAVDSTGAATEASSLMTITKDYITATNTSSDPDRGYLMNLLGYNVDPTNPSAITATSLSAASELRQMGGVMHSLPLLLTQKGVVTISNGQPASTNRSDYVMFGSTEGLLHVVDASTGVEKFAFLPNEMVAKQKAGFYTSTTTAGGIANLFYGVDGPWVAYTEYVPDGSGGLTVGAGKSTGTSTTSQGKQWVYGGLRMGGKSYYSLDLTNLSSPSLKFHIYPDTAAASSPLSYMGQSWSKPTIAYVKWKGVRKLVMFVGGGYDTGYETDSYDQTNGVGAGVYMFDATNGNLLWWASNNATTANTGATNQAINVPNMKYSVVSRINAVDRNADGYVDHLFFGDLGGQVWRIDLNNSISSSNDSATTPVPFATHAVRLLNAHNTTTAGASPRFYDAATFTVYKSNPTFGVVNIGSGNRSQPLKDYTTNQGRSNDAIYTIYDKDVATSSLYNTAQSALITQNLTVGTSTNSTTALTLTDRNTTIPYATAGGWYYPFASTSAGAKIQDAKVMGDPVAINSNLYVSVFDSAAPGLSGDCGAGVKGATSINRFCLPYSKCSDNSSNQDNTLFVGAGIIGVTIGPGDGSSTSRQVVGGNCTSGACASNSNGTGTSSGFGVKQILSTTAKLIPIRWYEKLPKSATGN